MIGSPWLASPPLPPLNKMKALSDDPTSRLEVEIGKLCAVMQVLEDHGSAVACAVNAACTALVDAAIPMNRLFGKILVYWQWPTEVSMYSCDRGCPVAASVCCCTTREGQLLIDPSITEEQVSPCSCKHAS